MSRQENGAKLRRSLHFSPLFVSHLLDYDYDFCVESDFNNSINVERKRTERSKKPFLLMLADVKDLPKNRDSATTLERIAFALCSSARKIDRKGWYKSGAIFGVIYTELKDTGEEIRKRIGEKINSALSEVLKPYELQKIKISFHSFPDDSVSEDGGQKLLDLCLYPDLSKKNSSSRVSLLLKRLMDVVGSACALIILAPLFLIIAVIIRTTSDGPVLYRQTRVGMGGKRFTFLKFRSMYLNSEPDRHIEYIRKYINGGREAAHSNNAKEEGAVYKITDDPRVTPFGRILRKTSLDELPQFINVLKGNMSLVGPRPPIPYECENYEIWHRSRVLESKPGLTGLWQIKGRSKTAFDEMVRMDLEYVRQWSIWLDLKILFQTPATVIAGKGAY